MARGFFGFRGFFCHCAGFAAPTDRPGASTLYGARPGETVLNPSEFFCGRDKTRKTRALDMRGRHALSAP